MELVPIEPSEDSNHQFRKRNEKEEKVESLKKRELIIFKRRKRKKEKGEGKKKLTGAVTCSLS